MTGHGTCSECGGTLHREAWYSEHDVDIDCCRCGRCGSDGLLIHGPEGQTWQQGCVEIGATPVEAVEELGCLRPLVNCIPGLEVEQ